MVSTFSWVSRVFVQTCSPVGRSESPPSPVLSLILFLRGNKNPQTQPPTQPHNSPVSAAEQCPDTAAVVELKAGLVSVLAHSGEPMSQWASLDQSAPRAAVLPEPNDIIGQPRMSLCSPDRCSSWWLETTRSGHWVFLTTDHSGSFIKLGINSTLNIPLCGWELWELWLLLCEREIG